MSEYGITLGVLGGPGREEKGAGWVAGGATPRINYISRRARDRRRTEPRPDHPQPGREAEPGPPTALGCGAVGSTACLRNRGPAEWPNREGSDCPAPDAPLGPGVGWATVCGL